MIRRSLALVPLAWLIVAAPALTQPFTMDSLWPNADGRSWRYAQHYESLDPSSPMTVDNQTRIYFDGMVVAPDGIDCQYLRQEVIGSTGPAITAVNAIQDPLLRQVWIARPDLHSRIQRVIESANCPENPPAGSYAFFLDGELAFRKTADEIAAWRCNQPDTRSWLWLVSNVTVGNTFSLQLLPDLATDVELRGTVAAIEPIAVPAGSFPTSLRVDYVVDYGTSECTDESGNLAGQVRYETRGHVHYVPDVGPVESHEEFVIAERTGTCGPDLPVGQPIGLTTMSLQSLPTPVRSTSWGAVKMLYR